MADGITSGAILKRGSELVRGNIGLALGVLAGLVALSVALDMLTGPDGRGTMFITGLATVLGQFLVTRKVMEDRGLLSSGAEGYRATGFGAVFGVCLLLIVPGIFLATRWFAAVPALFGAPVGVTGALGESWERTKGHAGAIFGAMVLIYLPMIIAAFAVGVLSVAVGGAAGPTGVFGVSLLVNAVATAAAIFGWHAAIAFWDLRAPAASTLAEVFA